jgi:hypothetical protein
MIRLICRFTIASIVLLALLILVARVIGGRNKPAALAMLAPGNCPQPCWHGIQPGITTMEGARAILGADPAIEFVPPPSPIVSEGLELCWHVKSAALSAGCMSTSGESGGQVAFLVIRLHQGAMRLGDIINLVGQPASISVCSSIERIISTLPRPHWSVYAISENHTAVEAYGTLYLANGFFVWRIDPNMIVYDIVYSSPRANYDSEDQKWRGFKQIIAEGYECGARILP